MFENELQDLRRYKWRVDTPTRAVFTVDDAREFLHNVGFCLEYPLRPPVLTPTFIGAVTGSDKDLPTAKVAFLHPRAKEAVEFKVRLLREKAAFEAGFGEDDNLLISAQEFPYFYALIGDRNPKTPPSAGERGERQLLRHAWELIQEHGPILETDLRKRLGESVSDVALSRTLSDLRMKLRVVRIDDEGGAMWDLLMRWAPQVVNQGKQISAQEALSALVAKYLETCVAAEQKEVEEFFGHIVPRSRVADVIKALQAAREFGFIQVSGRNLLRNSPRLSAEEKAAQIAAAAAPKPEGFANRSFRQRPEGEAPKKNVWEKYGPKKDKFDKRAREKGEDRPWKKAEGDVRTAGGFKSGFKSARPDWKKSGPKRPWQKPMAGGVGAAAERSFRPAGDRPPKRFGEKREWKKPEDRAGSSAPRGDGKKSGITAKKFSPRPEWKKREGGPADAGAPPRREWKKPGEGRPDFKGRRKEWSKPGGPRDWKKSGPKRPWQKPVEGAAPTGESAASRPPFKKSGFKKSGTAGGGFKKPGFKKAGFKKEGFKKSGPPGAGGFKKSFKKPFKKSSRPGGSFKPKAGPRRPA